MPLNRIHKEFVFPLVNPIDAKTIRVDRAFGRLLLLIKTGGRDTKAAKKKPILIRNLAEAIMVDQANFAGFADEKAVLLARWLESDFADVVRTGRGGRSGGEAVLAGLIPLHLDVAKLLHPVYAKDYGTSRFLYSVVSQSRDLMDVLQSFFGVGSVDDHYDGSDLDVETLFLLRLLDGYEFDRHSLQRETFPKPLCRGETAVFVEDLQRVMLYAQLIPRRELIRYILTLISFHLALSMLKTFRIINGMIEKGQDCRESCQCDLRAVDPTPGCPYRLDVFVDLSEQRGLRYTLAQLKVQEHYGEVSRYIKSHIRLKKLAEFGDWLVARGYARESPRTIRDLLRLQSHPRIDTFCGIRIEDLLTPEGDEEPNEQLKGIARLGMDALDTYIEMLYFLRQDYHMKSHRRMLDSFCGKNLDTGFLWVGRGRAGRRYYLGTELLETLVQVAVMGCDDPTKGFNTRGITIADFVTWLKNRYGVLIDEYVESEEGVELTQAMRQNYEALKFRLRQLGFYSDVSDASNSQLIQPRFKVEDNRH